MKRSFPFFLCLAFLSLATGAQQTVSPDDTARFLAGLPLDGTALERFSSDPAWAQHSRSFDRAWKNFEQGQLAKIRAWEQANLSIALSSKSPVFYLFSGPDALYAQTFFPNAKSYLLAGLEPVGTPPDVTQLPPGSMGPALAQLRNSLDTAFSFSFFKTKNMKEDLSRVELGGTLPILYVFLVRSGIRIQSVELFAIDKTGAPASPGKGTIPGVKITFSRGGEGKRPLFGGGGEQTLYYFSTNLSDEGVEANPGFIRFCEAQGRGNSLLKAASYLMHNSYFGKVRGFLLRNSDLVVQDDSGIPVRFFAPAKLEVNCFGNYLGPIDLFKGRYQSDLAAQFQTQQVPALPFSFGYRWHSKESCLIVARAKS